MQKTETLLRKHGNRASGLSIVAHSESAKAVSTALYNQKITTKNLEIIKNNKVESISTSRHMNSEYSNVDDKLIKE